MAVGLFLVKGFAARTQAPTFGQVINRSPRANPGVSIVGCKPGGQPKESWFPARMTPRIEGLFGDTSGETGDIIDYLKEGPLHDWRLRTRQHLRDLGAQGTWIGDFFNLDKPDEEPHLFSPQPGPAPVVLTPEPNPPTSAPPAKPKPRAPSKPKVPARGGDAPDTGVPLLLDPEAGDPLTDILGNVFTGGIYGAVKGAEQAERVQAIERERAERFRWGEPLGLRRTVLVERRHHRHRRPSFDVMGPGGGEAGALDGRMLPPALGSDASAPLTTGIGIAPSTALEQLLAQLDRRFPFRGKGTLDGVGEDGVLRVTDDPGRNGALRTGPDIAMLKGAALADRRTLRTEILSDSTRTRYLAIVAKPSMVADTRMWDLSALDATANADAGHGEASGTRDPSTPSTTCRTARRPGVRTRPWPDPASRDRATGRSSRPRAEGWCCMCQRSTKGAPTSPCTCSCALGTDAAPRQRSYNYDNVTGKRLNPAGGHYMIPADQYATVVARAAFDPRILNCYRFVPLPAPAPPCLGVPSSPARPRRR